MATFYPTTEYNSTLITIDKVLRGTALDPRNLGDRFNLDHCKYISYDSGVYIMHMDDGQMFQITPDDMAAIIELINASGGDVAMRLNQLVEGLVGETLADGSIDDSNSLSGALESSLATLAANDHTSQMNLLANLVGGSMYKTWTESDEKVFTTTDKISLYKLSVGSSYGSANKYGYYENDDGGAQCAKHDDTYVNHLTNILKADNKKFEDYFERPVKTVTIGETEYKCIKVTGIENISESRLVTRETRDNYRKMFCFFYGYYTKKNDYDPGVQKTPSTDPYRDYDKYSGNKVTFDDFIPSMEYIEGEGENAIYAFFVPKYNISSKSSYDSLADAEGYVESPTALELALNSIIAYEYVREDYYICKKSVSTIWPVVDENKGYIKQKNSMMGTIKTTLENGLGGISGIADALKGSSDKDTVSGAIANVATILNSITSNINTINNSITTINNSITTVNNSITTINNSITAVNKNINSINSNVMSYKGGVHAPYISASSTDYGTGKLSYSEVDKFCGSNTSNTGNAEENYRQLQDFVRSIWRMVFDIYNNRVRITACDRAVATSSTYDTTGLTAST